MMKSVLFAFLLVFCFCITAIAQSPAANTPGWYKYTGTVMPGTVWAGKEGVNNVYVCRVSNRFIGKFINGVFYYAVNGKEYTTNTGELLLDNPSNSVFSWKMVNRSNASKAVFGSINCTMDECRVKRWVGKIRVKNVAIAGSFVTPENKLHYSWGGKEYTTDKNFYVLTSKDPKFTNSPVCIDCE